MIQGLGVRGFRALGFRVEAFMAQWAKEFRGTGRVSRNLIGPVWRFVGLSK